MPETKKANTETKTTVVKEEKSTSQSPTTGAATKVETKTTTTTAATEPKKVSKEALDARMKKIVNLTSFGSSVGLVAGLGYSFYKGKGFWAYIGYGILGSVVFGTVTNLGARAILKPEEKKA